jgi:hypothetical protein
MTPKQKAQELVDKFMLHNSYQSIVWYNAKQCALIAVEEIETVLLQERVFESLDYWQEVKKEIELL